MTAPPLILPIIHYTVCSISLVSGSILFYLLIFHTPMQLKPFAILLRTLTLVELSASVSAALLFPRIIPLGIDAAAGVINGPIKLMTDNLSISWVLYTMELHGTQQHNVFMCSCYCYRYYVLRRKTPTINAIRLFSGTVFIGSFSLYVLFGMSRASPEELSVYINRFANQYVIDLRETFGVVNVLGSRVTIPIVWTVINACVVSVVNAFVGTAIYRYLKYHSGHISEKTRAHHNQFFTALTVQALFCQLLMLSAGGYALEQLNLIRSPFLEYGTHMISEIAIATSPVTTLIFVTPYRRALMSFFRRHKIGLQPTATTTHTRTN